jgi:hypothetical protein
MSASSIPTVLDALRAGVASRPAMSRVQVATAYMLADTAPQAVVFHTVTGDQTPMGMSSLSREENYTISGSCFCLAPGADETAIKKARDGAFALIAEVEGWVNDNGTVSGTCLNAEMGESIECKQGAEPDGRWTEVTFTIEVKAVIAPS